MYSTQMNRLFVGERNKNAFCIVATDPPARSTTVSLKCHQSTQSINDIGSFKVLSENNVSVVKMVFKKCD